MQTIYLDISNKGVIPVIYAKQGDVGRKVEVVLTNAGLPYEPEAGSAFSAWFSGASGMGNYTDIGERSAFSVSGNKVTVELITQMLQNAGEGILCLVLSRANDDQIGLWNVRYICEDVPGVGSEPAKDYYTAFSKAVADLPYPDVSLSVAGKAADAAAVSTALDGKAPAGYGLGEQAFNAPGNDANQITKCGFFRAYVNTPTGDWWTIQQEDLYGDGKYMIQKASCYAYIHVLHAERMIINGSFYEWEWVNPPMILGVEYRTTERYNDKPVYTKLIDLGALPNAGTKTVENLAEHADRIVDAVFNTARTDACFYNQPEVLSWYVGSYGSAYIAITTDTDMSNTTARVALKYTKTTD